MKKLHNLKYLLFLFLIGGILLLYYAKTSPNFAESYAVNIYPAISKAIGFLPSLVPISIAEIIVGLFALWVIIYIIKFIVKLIRGKKSRGKSVVNFVVNPILLASVLFFVYVINMGVNYYRAPFAETANIPSAQGTTADLASLCKDLSEKCNDLGKLMQRDQNGVTVLKQDFGVTAKIVSNSYNNLEKDYPTLVSGYGDTKPVFFSEVLSYANLTGITFPFTTEGNINKNAPAFSIPFTMAHELTHVKGYMQEDEANFLAYLVCSRSDSTQLNYSSAIMGFIYAGNALNSKDSEAYLSIFRLLDDNVKNDIKYNYTYWSNYKGAIADVATKVNDTYLKANSQAQGVQSYGKVVDLMLDYYLMDNQQ